MDVYKLKDLVPFSSKVNGQYAVEVEFESSEPILLANPVNWRITTDGSLKNYGLEAVMKGPKTLAKASNCVSYLYEEIVEAQRLNDSKWIDSIRAAVHVHVNMRDKTFEQILKTACIYYMFETVLTRYCGEGRTGNLFCLRNRDAEGMLFLMQKAADSGSIFDLKNGMYRYASLNLQSLFKYGSIEFRAMRTPVKDPSRIIQWMHILDKIIKYGENEDCGVSDLEYLSGHGGEALMEKVFGPELKKVLWYADAEQDIIEDSRLVQWTMYSLEG